MILKIIFSLLLLIFFLGTIIIERYKRKTLSEIIRFYFDVYMFTFIVISSYMFLGIYGFLFVTYFVSCIMNEMWEN